MAGFPRMLFPNGVAGEPRLVHSEEEEAQARAEGWRTYGEVGAPPQMDNARVDEVRSVVAQFDAALAQPKRRGRPPKVRP